LQYILTFLEGLISFISPCMLPMLPIYVSYFAGGADKRIKSLPRALSFVLGFTLVYCTLGLFAGTVGVLLTTYRTAVNIVSGLIVIILGLSYLDIIHIPFFHGINSGVEVKGIFSAFLFGIIFSISHTPCIGAFLGSALALASSSGTVLKGVMLLLSYSLGMGIPFLVSAVLIEKLSGLFTIIKKHYKVINIVCGVFLIIIGITMMTGLLHSFLHLISGGHI